MLIEEVDYLKQWLIEKLKAISEADPNVLAKYVIALLKKDDNFNQDAFVEQLEVFLNDATIPFVRNLYEVIESKEYMPVPPKKKRIFTEVKREQIEEEPEVIPIKEESRSGDRVERIEQRVDRVDRVDRMERVERSDRMERMERRIHIDPKVVDTRLVELSIDPALELEDKLTARKRRFEEDRDRRKRATGRREEEGGYSRRVESYDERRDRPSRYADHRTDRTERAERIRSDDRYGGRVGYPKSSSRRHHSPLRGYSRSPSPRRSRSPTSPPPSRNGAGRRCRDFNDKGYCLRGGLCPYDHGSDPVIVEESSLPTLLQAANNPVLPPPPAVFPPVPIFPPGEMLSAPMPIVPPTLPSQPLPPPPPVSVTPAPTGVPSSTSDSSRNYTIKRAPSAAGVPRSFKLVDGSNIITGVVVPPADNKTTLIIRDIPYPSNDSALLAHHLGRFGAIKQLQCKVYNDNHTATVEFYSHDAAMNCFNSNLALLGCRYIKLFWREVIPISLASTVFKNVGNVTKSSIHQDMNLVNKTTTTTATAAAAAAVSTTAAAPAPKPAPPRESNITKTKKLELAKRTQGLLSQNLANQKLILNKLETCKVSSEKKELMVTLRRLQESHATIKASLTGLDLESISAAAGDRKRKAPVSKTTRGANTNLDLRPKEIVVKNCENAEELQEHFSKFGPCTVLPSAVGGVIIGFDRRRDAEMAYVKGRMVEEQELEIEWNSPDEVQTAAPNQVPVEPIR